MKKYRTWLAFYTNDGTHFGIPVTDTEYARISRAWERLMSEGEPFTFNLEYNRLQLSAAFHDKVAFASVLNGNMRMSILNIKRIEAVRI